MKKMFLVLYLLVQAFLTCWIFSLLGWLGVIITCVVYGFVMSIILLRDKHIEREKNKIIKEFKIAEFIFEN